ncbi:hypothetical protein TREMEDRAFT_59937 [Tremella mesenterica DSM 1558]|uniref:uncharacterized protein n=1 Tax=Tremella mesenterica (strain ATCC 24925 / CBS 8224 / DSM 1558 / NBRC 9311 / NRRL Y-6157 / RJB 2259-6 / UBC 559-6) TaxID=578456 RepID=UPI0003F4A0AD|nr:uncharacterized protein TREMEDRAFT_59937 [Tremella mesenterica DSM 1558]EIW70994.1 hypothetical protein TREMEDRAFT_59937 [Tremella mesenterica DSM 1558]
MNSKHPIKNIPRMPNQESSQIWSPWAEGGSMHSVAHSLDPLTPKVYERWSALKKSLIASIANTANTEVTRARFTQVKLTTVNESIDALSTSLNVDPMDHSQVQRYRKQLKSAAETLLNDELAAIALDEEAKAMYDDWLQAFCQDQTLKIVCVYELWL